MKISPHQYRVSVQVILDAADQNVVFSSPEDSSDTSRKTCPLRSTPVRRLSHTTGW
jgi:hypothetical protein